MKAKLFLSAVLTVFSTVVVYADIPAPKETPSADWTFVLMGAITAFLGGVLFVWLGRKWFKRTQ
jgi:hypothetical protein